MQNEESNVNRNREATANPFAGIGGRKVVGFARSATENAESIERQVTAIRDLARRYGAEIVEMITVSGESGMSQDTMDMLIALKQRDGIENVLIASEDRLSRGLQRTIAIRSTLREHGINVISVSDQDDPRYGELLKQAKVCQHVLSEQVDVVPRPERDGTE